MKLYLFLLLLTGSSTGFVRNAHSALINEIRSALKQKVSVKDKARKSSELSLLGSTKCSGRLLSQRLYATEHECDILILGSGPAARAAATQFAKRAGRKTILADSNYDKPWIPNYGVWEDEWEAVSERYCFEDSEGSSNITSSSSLSDCINRKWPVTDCYFGGSFDIPTESRLRVDRPYYRVDRNKLRETLSPKDDDDDSSYKVIKANHISESTSLNLFNEGLVHYSNHSKITLSNGDEVTAKLIVDCTGHESKLIHRDPAMSHLKPGFQIAYGMTVIVKPLINNGNNGEESELSFDGQTIGPYDKEAMTLFDYRTDHFVEGSVSEEKAVKSPTFMYAMPLKDNKIFFEETSLVARPAISFQECKERCYTRLKYLGIDVIDVEEEEFCYIPMGGPLPSRDQRVVAFGGAAAMVHPSTGYNLCRNLISASDMVDAVDREFRSSVDNQFNPDRAAANAYDSLWSKENIRQRNFAVFGGEFLMKQNVVGLRGFFDGFFRLPVELWGGFLAGWPGLPNNSSHESWLARMWFGVTFLTKLPLPVAADMLFSIITYSIKDLALIQSVTPLLGQPVGYSYLEKPQTIGDIAAKKEAYKMIKESQVADEPQVEFEEMKV